MAYTAEEVLAIIIGISGGGRGGGVNPENPLLGIPSFSDALAEDRSRSKKKRGKGGTRGKQPSRKFALPRTKQKRSVSAYQREFGRQLKKLKKKHPRTPVTKLMKRAHAATKRARRGK